LHRVVAHGLIFRSGVTRPEVEQLVVRCVWASAERDADETGHPDTGRGGHLHGHICLDRPVLKLRPFDKGENVSIRLFGQKNGIAALIFDYLGFPAGEDKGIGVTQREAFHSLCGRVRIAGLLRIRRQDCRDGYEQYSELAAGASQGSPHSSQTINWNPARNLATTWWLTLCPCWP
jgi:hypothetical protein